MRLLPVLLIALPFAAPATANVADLARATAPDSLSQVLRAYESQHDHDAEGGAAALELGSLHYARGEYRQAADAFARAAARLDAARRLEARWGSGMSALALGDGAGARGPLEEVARSTSGRRQLAALGVAIAWELEQRPERALEQLQRLLAADPGEAGAPALERFAALASRLNRDGDARHARERLLRDYPRSMEAARLAAHPLPAPAPEGESSASVQLGSFTNLARARALSAAAQRAGYTDARVLERRDAGGSSWLVRLGPYASVAEARRAGERAGRTLGTGYQVVPSR